MTNSDDQTALNETEHMRSGSHNTDDDAGSDELTSIAKSDLNHLLVENEQLNRALTSLTSHLAQVQLRLGQIVNSSNTNGGSVSMIKSLEEFASQGIPDIESFAIMKQQSGSLAEPPTQQLLDKQRIVLQDLASKLNISLPNLEQLSEQDLQHEIDRAVDQFLRPFKTNGKLVDQLKTQVLDLERFIEYLHGTGSWSETLSQSLGELRKARDSVTDTSSPLDESFGQQWGQTRLLGGSRRKEKSIKTLTLMQRALTLLQLLSLAQLPDCSRDLLASWTGVKRQSTTTTSSSSHPEAVKHWGRVRARLELAISLVIDKANLLTSIDPTLPSSSSYASLRPARRKESTVVGSIDTASSQPVPLANLVVLPVQQDPAAALGKSSRRRLLNGLRLAPLAPGYWQLQKHLRQEAKRLVARAVTHQLCPALRDLIQHGLRNRRFVQAVCRRSNFLPFSSILGCFGATSIDWQEPDAVPSDFILENSSKSSAHAWDVLASYFLIKNGLSYTLSPTHQLAQSFELTLTDSSISSRQSFFQAIDSSAKLPNSSRRMTNDEKFERFVTLALNQGKLDTWLRPIFRSNPLLPTMYESWSYALSTGFEDALKSLDQLSGIVFNLPTNDASARLDFYDEQDAI